MHEEEPLQTLGLSQPSASPASAAPSAASADDLQFQKAEFNPSDAPPSCTVCKSGIGESYYHLDGNVICQSCAEQRQAGRTPTGPGVFRKSLLYGAGAALAGTALYAIVLLATDSEFGLISILVGIMVGKAMMRASGGRGGRKFQIAAVLLTYGGITAGYIPALVKGMIEAESAKAKESGAAKAGAPAPAPAAATTPEDQPLGIVGLIVAIVIMLGLALVMPFLMVTQGFSGILSMLIIFFGLQQAWSKTAGDTAILMGPYSASDLNPAAGA